MEQRQEGIRGRDVGWKIEKDSLHQVQVEVAVSAARCRSRILTTSAEEKEEKDSIQGQRAPPRNAMRSGRRSFEMTNGAGVRSSRINKGGFARGCT